MSALETETLYYGDCLDWMQRWDDQCVDRIYVLCAVPHKKWNPIEHRLFGPISINWAGRPLESFEVILNYIRTTVTRTGLRVRAERNTKTYKKGIRISKNQMAELSLQRDETLPQWNYEIRPRTADTAAAELPLAA